MSITVNTAPASDVHVAGFEPLPTPMELQTQLPVSAAARQSVERGRTAIADILSGRDDRLLVITGPCSVHDPVAALDYARRLRPIAAELSDDLLIVMRTYFEKPRSTVGWKGLINDPHLDGSHDIAAGLTMAREFLIKVGELGLPTATELLEPITPQYVADLIAWAAIGARTTESQIHRQLASGLSMPVGFKNATDGDVGLAIDGALAAARPQSFLGIDGSGQAASVRTTGNPDTHIVLRGGRSGPNYDAASVASAAKLADQSGVLSRLVVDASHGNSGKDHLRQAVVARELADQIASGSSSIGGVMVESFLVGGAQPLDVTAPAPLQYGQSVTDKCLSWETTVDVLTALAVAARKRRTS